MITIKNKFAILILLLLITASCTHKVASEEQYYKLINDPDNGLIKTKTVGDIKLTVRYLCPEFLAFKEWNGIEERSNITFDTLLKSYNNSLTFLMTIQQSKGRNSENHNLMYEGLDNFEDYKNRVHDMNFDFQHYLQLQYGDNKISPALCLMENSYGLSQTQNIYIVFSKEYNNNILNSQELDITYDDETFNTGINHFVFTASDIFRANKIKFVHNKNQK